MENDSDEGARTVDLVSAHEDISLDSYAKRADTLRERARAAAALVMTLAGAVLTGLLLNLNSELLTGPSEVFALVGFGGLVASLGLLLRASLQVAPSFSRAEQQETVEKLYKQIIRITKWGFGLFVVGLVGLGIALVVQVVGNGEEAEVDVTVLLSPAGRRHVQSVCGEDVRVIVGRAPASAVESSSRLAVSLTSPLCDDVNSGSVHLRPEQIDLLLSGRVG